MRVLVVTDSFWPETNSGANRAFEHCREWVALGASVTAVTSVPNFPKGITYSGYRNRLCQEEQKDGIRIVRVWTYMAPNDGIARRCADYLSFAVASFIAGLREEPDIVVATSPQLLAALSGCLLAAWKRRPWIFEVRDLWPDSVLGVGIMARENIMIRTLSRLERWLYRRADRIVAVSEELAKVIAQRCDRPSKIAVVSNGVDAQMFVPSRTTSALRDCLGLAGRFVIGYVGTLGYAQGLDTVLDAAGLLTDENVAFFFVGEGARRDHLRRKIASMGLTNVVMLDTVPRADIPDHIAACDTIVVPLRKHPALAVAVPAKTFEAAAMEKPILVSTGIAAAALVDRFKAGIAFETENPVALADAIRTVMSDRELAGRLASGGRRLAAAHRRADLAQAMYREILSTLHRETTAPVPGSPQADRV